MGGDGTEPDHGGAAARSGGARPSPALTNGAFGPAKKNRGARRWAAVAGTLALACAFACRDASEHSAPAAEPAARQALSPQEQADLDRTAWEADPVVREALAAARYGDALEHVLALLIEPRASAGQLLPLVLLGVDAARRSGELRTANQLCREADELLEQLGGDWPFRGAYAIALLDLRARVAQDLGRPDEAARHLSDAREVALTSGEEGALLSIEVGLASLWLEAQQYELAEAQVAATLARLDADSHGAIRAALELCLATSLLARGREEASIEVVERAAAMLGPLVESASASPRDQVRGRLRLSEAHVRLGNFRAATEQLQRADEELGALQLAVTSPEHTMAGWLRLWLMRVQTNPREDSDTYAEELSSAGQHFAAWRAHIRQSPLLPDGVGLLHRVEVRGYLGEYLALEAAREHGHALALLAQVHALASRHRRAGRDAPGRIDAEALGLGPDTGALVFFTATPRSLLFLVDHTGIELHFLPDTHTIRSLRDSFAAAGPLDMLGPAQRRLGTEFLDALVPEAARARMARWSRAALVGLDLVGYVPVELLPLPDGTPFGERFAVSYVPDLVTLAWLVEREASGSAANRSAAQNRHAPDVAYLAAPSLAPDLEALRLDRRARRNLAAGTGRGRLMAFEGTKANSANLRRAAEGGARLLHVLTHGVALSDGRIGTGLALSRGRSEHEVVAPDDVESLRRVPPIVVLSACRAGRDSARRGDAGLEGWAGVLLERGAQVVLLPYEDVAMEDVLESIAVLQPLLLEGMPAADALRRSQFTGAASTGRSPRVIYHAVGLGHRSIGADGFPR